MDAYELIALLVEELPTHSTREQFRFFRAQVQGVHGATDATDDDIGYELDLLFEPPLDARRVAEVLGVRSGYLVSTDVHQREFCIMSSTGVLQTRSDGAKRIVTERPKRGVWWVNASGPRPEGPLPNVSSGASPAYPLSSYNTAIKQLIIIRARD